METDADAFARNWETFCELSKQLKNVMEILNANATNIPNYTAELLVRLRELHQRGVILIEELAEFDQHTYYERHPDNKNERLKQLLHTIDKTKNKYINKLRLESLKLQKFLELMNTQSRIDAIENETTVSILKSDYKSCAEFQQRRERSGLRDA